MGSARTRAAPLLWKFLTCETHRALEGAAHAFEAVLYQVTLKFSRGVKGLAAEFALMVQPFICRGKHMGRRGQTYQLCDRARLPLIASSR